MTARGSKYSYGKKGGYEQSRQAIGAGLNVVWLRKTFTIVIISATVQQNSVIRPCCLRGAKASTINFNLVHLL